MRRSSVEEEVSRRRGVKGQEGQDNESHEYPITVWRAGLTTALTKACGREGSGRWSGVEWRRGRVSVGDMRLMNVVLLRVYFAFQHVSLANEQSHFPGWVSRK